MAAPATTPGVPLELVAETTAAVLWLCLMPGILTMNAVLCVVLPENVSNVMRVLVNRSPVLPL